MLLNELRQDDSLSHFVRSTCCDEEDRVCVDIDENIPENDIVIFKVDSFYANEIRTDDRPKSPDCLIVQRCNNSHFHIYFVELKDVKYQSSSSLKRNDIWEKFNTGLKDFMSNRFRIYFYNTKYKFKLHLILVAGKPNNKYNKNFNFKFLLGLDPLYFANKRVGIQGKNPNPVVRPC